MMRKGGEGEKINLDQSNRMFAKQSNAIKENERKITNEGPSSAFVRWAPVGRRRLSDLRFAAESRPTVGL